MVDGIKESKGEAHDTDRGGKGTGGRESRKIEV